MLRINPEFSRLTQYVKHLPDGFDGCGEELYKVRNEVRLIEVDGVKLVVKKFKVPHLINRIAYGFFRKSKARRSYEYSKMLLEKGFGAAVPVAYREDKNLGFLSTSYFVSLYCDYGRDFNEFRRTETDGREDVLRDFARFTARLHDAGIQHLDYGGGNILFRQKENKTEFCLIDINRMRLGPVDMKSGCENFRLLYMTEEPFRILMKEYALARGFDADSCIELIKPYIHTKS